MSSRRVLEYEAEYYDSHENELLELYPGRYIVVVENEILASFDTFWDAYAAGLAKWGNRAMMVRKVGEPILEVQIFSIAATVLGTHP
jgi:hypothetical protein